MDGHQFRLEPNLDFHTFHDPKAESNCIRDNPIIIGTMVSTAELFPTSATHYFPTVSIRIPSFKEMDVNLIANYQDLMATSLVLYAHWLTVCGNSMSMELFENYKHWLKHPLRTAGVYKFGRLDGGNIRVLHFVVTEIFRGVVEEINYLFWRLIDLLSEVENICLAAGQM